MPIQQDLNDITLSGFNDFCMVWEEPQERNLDKIWFSGGPTPYSIANMKIH
jgi:hypothetical protein